VRKSDARYVGDGAPPSGHTVVSSTGKNAAVPSARITSTPVKAPDARFTSIRSTSAFVLSPCCFHQGADLGESHACCLS